MGISALGESAFATSSLPQIVLSILSGDLAPADSGSLVRAIWRGASIFIPTPSAPVTANSHTRTGWNSAKAVASTCENPNN